MHYIYDFFIQPLVLVYDVIYTILYRIIQQPVVAILALSIIINFLALPLYRKADLLQKEEIDKQKKMKPWLDHIKTHFSGDERFMMTQAYYRIEHYTPLSILKEAGPLALQIPFFMAAYNYISNIPLLETSSFGPINNLLAPDALITIGGFSINILPIIMTIINLISGYTYSKEGPLRQKIQIYVIAAVFLVLLYNSASGLVIYWIMNQIFSLGKNIYYTRGMKEKTKIVVKVVVAVALILYLELTLVLTGVMGSVEVLAGQIVLIICAAVLLITALRMKGVKPPSIITKVGSVFGSLGDRRAISAVLLVEASLVALLGFYIPSSVLSASVVDFIDSSTGTFPFNLLVYPAVVYSGLLLLWMTVILFSRDRKKRRNMLLGLWAFFGVALVNHFFFDPQVGSLYANLLYDGTVKTDLWRSALNIFVCIVAGLFFMILIAKKPKWAKNIAAVIIVVLVGLGTYNIIQINNGVATAKAGEVIDNSSEKAINLSKTGHNVVVMMLDRAIGTYVPYIFDEKPELKEAYKGFVYYPNTVSFGLHTKFGSPGLFGGYEYNPWEFNEQSDRPNVDQHNEALSVMPVLFQQNGYQVTVCDVPFGNYWWNSDLSFYEKYPGIETKHLIGRFLTMLEGDMGASTDFQSRNFIMYGLFRALPLPLKTAIYDNGYYVTLKNTAIVSSAFIDNYSELAALKDITSTSNDDKNVFIMMQNATPHCPTFLNPPNYSLSTNDVVDTDYEYSDKEYQGRILRIRTDSEWSHYCVNVASYQAIAEWLEYLKKQDLYDNTRIILVADHGYFLEQFEDLIHPDGMDVESANPLLMVKDFYSNDPFAVDNTIMTNADVPYLSTEGLIENAANPFTGVSLDGSEIKANGVLVNGKRFFGSLTQDETTFDLSGENWWIVHDNIFDLDNWKKLSREEVKSK